ncbi:hypothetical protein HS088_TW06G00113 [Tripterygium wilfordii]|uniref:Transmembrane protein n=1 Tax=Tripterygium wilfordii TaxID=458696 RepID=A0A7J7DI27_TRIWF|nr:uncharacterized protein LOC120001070 [Tripterygium wilfordii]XP_038705239.1 uncharacterized protein LOC120001070 [Tripterygium wilfordii]KAF5745948.1 hypothetical protein HS088_TW06G00113 [Tripterygium wilfordii]
MWSKIRMDNLIAQESDLEVDLESGGTTSEEDRGKDSVSNSRQRDQSRNVFWSGSSSHDGLVNSSRVSEVVDGDVELLMEKNSEGEENQEHNVAAKTRVEEKRKKRTSRKAPKPPRPPKGPSLDAADEKLVREIAELAMRRRARMERIKTLKKMRAAKSSSLNSSLPAMVITLLFLVIIFHGICSRGSPSSGALGSPAPAIAMNEGLISIQFHKNFNMDDERNGPSFGTFSSAEEQVSSSGSTKEVSRIGG